MKEIEKRRREKKERKKKKKKKQRQESERRRRSRSKSNSGTNGSEGSKAAHRPNTHRLERKESERGKAHSAEELYMLESSF